MTSIKEALAVSFAQRLDGDYQDTKQAMQAVVSEMQLDLRDRRIAQMERLAKLLEDSKAKDNADGRVVNAYDMALAGVAGEVASGK